MRLLIILSLIGVSLTSPIVKRTKERLIYGNQQNGPKIKKSDPNMAVLPDLHGDVQALDAKDIIDTNTDDQNKVIDSKDESKAIEKELIDQVMTEENENTDNNNEKDTSDNTENESTDQVDQTENNDVDNAKFSETAMAEITPEQENSIEQLEKVSEDAETENNAETGDKEPTNDATNTDENKIKIPNEWYQAPLDLYKNYQNDYYSNYPEDFLSYYDLLGRKRRMARRRANSPIDAPIKRSRRIKRDLPDEILYDPYYLSGAEYPVTTYEDDLEEPYVYSPDDNIEAYLELLEEANKADPRLMETEELVPTFYMAKRVIYNGEPGYFVPVKRQSYSFDNKRDQYFYPFSEEPQTHFSAFVPQKRNYADTYGDLLSLAKALGRADREGYQWQSKK